MPYAAARLPIALCVAFALFAARPRGAAGARPAPARRAAIPRPPAAAPPAERAAEAPEPSLSVEVTPSRVVLGEGDDAVVKIAMRLPDASARAGLAALRVDATAGRITGLRALGDGRFEATLEPPAERFPQFAVVSVADVASPDPRVPPPVRVAVVAYAARLELKGNSDPRAEVTVEIGARRFGPSVADAAGHFAVPVVVEPGQGSALTTATDALGNTTRSRISLFLPAVQRLHAFVVPEALVADGRDRGFVYVTSLGQSGAPEETRVQARPSAGSLSAAEHVGAGVTRFAITAPAHADRAVVLDLAAPALKASSRLEVPLLAGRPSALAVSASPTLAPADGRTVTKVGVAARDADGNPAAGHRVVVGVDGGTLLARETQPGTYEAEVPPRATVGRARASVRLEPVAASCPRPVARVAGARLEVRDRRGIPCAGEVAAVGPDRRVRWRRTIEAGDERMGLELAAPPAADDLLVLTDGRGEEHVIRLASTAKGEATPADALEGAIDLAWRVPTPPELKLTVVGRTGGTVRVRLSAVGIDELARRVRVEAAGAAVREVGRADGTIDYAVERTGPGAVDVVATDGDSGVSAWLRVE